MHVSDCSERRVQETSGTDKGSTMTETKFQVGDVVKLIDGQAHWAIMHIWGDKELICAELLDIQGIRRVERVFNPKELELVSRPKNKVKKWRWVLYGDSDKEYMMVTSDHYSEEEQKERGAIQKIDCTEIEVEEE
jgi:hypothetical protein